MNKNPKPIYRLAIVDAHKWIGIICRKPIAEDFDIDRMIPKEMAEEAYKVEFEALRAIHDLGYLPQKCGGGFGDLRVRKKLRRCANRQNDSVPGS